MQHIKKKINGSFLFINLKEKYQYYKFLNNIRYGYHIMPKYDEESIFRTTFLSDYQRSLVQYCKDKNFEKLCGFYRETDNNIKYFDGYYMNRMSMRIIGKYIINHYNNAQILDVACGHGEIDIVLKKAGFDVWGIDMNPVRITSLVGCLNNAECIDIEHFKTNTRFDIILALECLEHVTDIQATLQKLYTLLKSGGGQLFISVPNEYRIDDEQHVRIFNPASLSFLLEKSGFVIETICILPYLNTENKNDLVCVCKKGNIKNEKYSLL